MPSSSKNYNGIIFAVSIAIPLVVAALYFLPKPDGVVAQLSVLPAVNAVLNGLTAVFLISAYVAIRNKKKQLHRNLMLVALGLSVLFLVGYVAYHFTFESTPYGGVGPIRVLYFSILISHIILAGVTVPLVLITFIRALNERFDSHRKIARITLPIWLYVTVTGVLVYAMIAPYYAH